MLNGSDVSFAGTLSGSTFESDQQEITPFSYWYPTESVWWNWTAAESATVTIQLTSPSRASHAVDVLSVYALDNISSGQLIAWRIIDTRFPELFFTFQAQAGTNYQIQLAGMDGAAFSLRLVATNTPVIIRQPCDLAVTTGDCLLFTTVVAGQGPLRYQWQFNGTNLDGETSPMLALEQAVTNQMGAYRVIITNLGGAVTSRAAQLFITETDPAPRLEAGAVRPTNAFAFALFGDPGRRYRIQSSTNLANWHPLTEFPSPPGSFDPVSYVNVVFDSTGADTFTSPLSGPRGFYRAVPYHANNEVCSNRLKQWRFGFLLAAYQKQLPFYATPTFYDAMPYLKDPFATFCPSGGSYSAGSDELGNPVCSIVGHILEEP